MNFWSSLRGEVEIKVITPDASALLERINRQGIALGNVRFEDELMVILRVSRQDGTRILKNVRQRGAQAEIVGRRGVFWKFSALWKRPVLLFGMGMLLFLTLFAPSRILFVRVDGNSSVPSRQILEAAENSGIRFGASRRSVRSEKVKNALLSEIPKLQWAGVNTSGCVATISVRERSSDPTEEKKTGVSSIVACRDGVILSCTAESGNLQCAPGDAVLEGQVLISGYTDCGLLIKTTRAEGEIYAQTRHQITVVTPSECLQRVQIKGQHRNYSLILGKKRINLWNGSGICDTTCGRMYAEYYIYLPGGFQLPLALAVDTHSCWEVTPGAYSSEEMEQALSDFGEGYLSSGMISGEILLSGERFFAADGLFRLEGDYLCREMIGRNRQEGKVETDGKSG